MIHTLLIRSKAAYLNWRRASRTRVVRYWDAAVDGDGVTMAIYPAEVVARFNGMRVTSIPEHDWVAEWGEALEASPSNDLLTRIYGLTRVSGGGREAPEPNDG